MDAEPRGRAAMQDDPVLNAVRGKELAPTLLAHDLTIRGLGMPMPRRTLAGCCGVMPAIRDDTTLAWLVECHGPRTYPMAASSAA